MNRFFLTALLLCSAGLTYAQTDTIRVNAQRLNTAAWREGKSSYAVYFEDSTGRRLSSADIWDRTLRLTTQNGQRQFTFSWDWYRRDSLFAHVTTTGQWPSLVPLTHDAVYAKRGSRSFVFQNQVVTVPDSARHSARDSSFRVTMQPPAFAFPMDLEILPLLPIRKVGQTFAVPFYEPGSPSSAYYTLSVTGREPLRISGSAALDCWLVRIDYAPGSYATFWISDRPREVVKMKEYFRGRYRYKVKLY